MREVRPVLTMGESETNRPGRHLREGRGFSTPFEPE